MQWLFFKTFFSEIKKILEFFFKKRKPLLGTLRRDTMFFFAKHVLYQKTQAPPAPGDMMPYGLSAGDHAFRQVTRACREARQRRRASLESHGAFV